MSVTRPSFLHRWRHTVAYFILAGVAVLAVTLSWRNQQDIKEDAVRDQDVLEAQQQAIEEQSQRASAENCESINEVRLIILGIIEELAARSARDSEDTRAEARDRAEVLEEIRTRLMLEECPPAPPYPSTTLPDDGD